MKKNYPNTTLNKYSTLLLLVFAFFFTNFSFGQTTVIYTTGGAKSWTCPAGVTSVQIEAWGGGAGGRTSGNSNGFVGGGGGGGAYARRNSIAVSVGVTYNFTVTLGTGGAANTPGTSTSTTFNTVYISAGGGSVGAASNTGTILGGLGGVSTIVTDGDVVFTGGNGGSGLGNGTGPGSGSGGGGGSAAGSTGIGNAGGNATTTNAPGAGGATVASFGGAGGAGGNNANGASATVNYGGGGGGAGAKNNTAGSGMSGAVIITFTCPPIVVNAGPDQNLTACSTTATLAGSAIPANTTGTWSIVSGTATITSPNSPTSGITGIVPGTPVTLRWTINNGQCGNTTDDVIITSPVGPSCLTYCTPSIGAAYAASTYYIKTVNFIGNITNSNNSSTSSSAPNGYQDRTGLGSRATQAQEEGVNIFVDNQLGANPVYMKVWVDWDRNGLFDDTTEMVYQCTNAFVNTTFGFKIPAATTPGNYRIRFRTNRASAASDNTFSSCGNIDNFGETEDYLFTVVANCAAKIVSKVDGSNCGNGTVTLSATGTAGTTSLNWYTAGGAFITNTPTSGQTASWTTPLITGTTNYYVTALNGACESLFKTLVTATIKPVPALSFSNANPEICGEDDKITISAAGTNEQKYLIDENFESGLGVFSNNQIASPNGSITNWQSRTSTYVPLYPTFPVWYPAISSGFGTNKFAMSTSDLVLGGTTAGKVNEALELTSTVNTVGFLNLNLSFKIYFSSYNDSNNAAVEGVFVEYKDGANPWTAVADANGTILTDQGIGTQFITKSINLAPQIGITNLKIRIRYRAGWCDGVAIDDVKLYGDIPLAPNFTWTGLPAGSAFTDLACTIPYVSGSNLTGPVYIKPTLSQLETGSYSFTANANLANTCTSSATINVTNKSKVWKGTTSNDWNVAGNWSPVGVPDANTCVIIPTGTTSQIMNTPNALAKNLSIKAPTGNLELQAAKNLTVTDFIKVETGATFNVRNSANLVQINDAPVPANSGSINMNRTATGLHPKDYVYWSAPVEGFGVTGVSPLTNTSRIYHWTPDYFNGALYGYGNWFNVNENMVAGKGYIIRVADSNPTFTTTFTGKPQNGVINRTLTKGPYVGGDYAGANRTITTLDDNWNLIGNPYPSAINAIEFLAANSAVIEGDVSLWTHTTPIAITTSPYYQNFVYNYKSSDYVTYNSSGASSGAGTFGGQIGAGQAFFVKMKDAPTGTDITFNNSMRTDASNNPYNNGQFYRNGDNTTAEPEKNRIWLDLIDSNLNTSRILVGYIEGATNDKDHLFDATTNYTESLKAFTSIGNNEEIYVIQGKGLPFDPADKISYGIQVPATGTYKIAISDVDGLFKTQGQKIYIEDLLTNVTQDLSTSPYTFTADKGTYKNRFVIKFDNQTLSNNDHEYANTVTVFGKQQLTIKSELFNIKNIVVYDLLGKTLLNNKDVNSKEYHLANLKNTNSTLLVKTTLENGAVVTKKVIF